jgi:hypothetical protein
MVLSREIVAISLFGHAHNFSWSVYKGNFSLIGGRSVHAIGASRACQFDAWAAPGASNGSENRMGTPKFEPPKPFKIAYVTPTTLPC